MVVGVYLGVQTVESYAITPLIQQERVSLSPALIISMQLLKGVLFGVLGLTLATPMASGPVDILERPNISAHWTRKLLPVEISKQENRKSNPVLQFT